LYLEALAARWPFAIVANAFHEGLTIGSHAQ